MAARCAVILTMLAGFELAASTQALHAKVRSPLYLVTEIALLADSHDYAREYTKSQPIITAAGGSTALIAMSQYPAEASTEATFSNIVNNERLRVCAGSAIFTCNED